jgi:hypothetical protein
MFLMRVMVDPRVERMRIPRRRLMYGCVVRRYITIGIRCFLDHTAVDLGWWIRSGETTYYGIIGLECGCAAAT